MATITAAQGVKTAFAGGADIFECYLGSAPISGVQVSATGFDLSACALAVRPFGSSDFQTVATTGVGRTGLVGQNFKVDAVRISALAGGSYSIAVL